MWPWLSDGIGPHRDPGDEDTCSAMGAYPLIPMPRPCPNPGRLLVLKQDSQSVSGCTGWSAVPFQWSIISWTAETGGPSALSRAVPGQSHRPGQTLCSLPSSEAAAMSRARSPQFQSTQDRTPALWKASGSLHEIEVNLSLELLTPEPEGRRSCTAHWQCFLIYSSLLGGCSCFSSRGVKRTHNVSELIQGKEAHK